MRKGRKRWIPVALMVLRMGTVHAQDDRPVSEPRRQLGIGLGGVHYQVGDRIVSPLRWDGFGAALELSYTVVHGAGRHQFAFRLPFAAPTNRYDHEAFAGALSTGYEYSHDIPGSVFGGRLHLGGFLEGNMNVQFYYDWDDSHIYWLTTYGLGPAARWDRGVGRKHRFAMRFNLPLLALVSRPPEHRYYDQGRMNTIGYWFTKPHEGMTLTSVHQYVSLRLRGDYLVRASPRLLLGASFLLSYQTFSEPQRIGIVTNMLLLRVMFTSR